MSADSHSTGALGRAGMAGQPLIARHTVAKQLVAASRDPSGGAA